LLMLFALLIVSITPTFAQDETIECEDGFRLFDHEFLATDPVCLPENPERIVPIDLIGLEFMLIHDIQPVVSSFAIQGLFASSHPDLLPLLQEFTAGLPDMGFPIDPEAILSAEPDLIIASTLILDPEIYDEMSQIAPVALFSAPFEAFGQDWRPSVDFIGQALNMTEEADAVLATYDERVASLQETLGEDYENTTISVVNVVSQDILRLRLAGSFSGILINDIGLMQPESQQAFIGEDGASIVNNISQERWTEIDADYVFMYQFGASLGEVAEVGAFLDDFADIPIWNVLEPVQEGRIYPVSTHWHGFGIFAAHAVLDDLFVIVAEAEPLIANPYTAETLSDVSPEIESTEEASD
ncbi:MAG: ABC transporter substrate-binding protein, partial [Chloroflexota bacterium]